MTLRKEIVDRAIERGIVEELLELAEGRPCACRGAVDDEPLCFCKMTSKQVRESVSYAALQRGRVVRLNG